MSLVVRDFEPGDAEAVVELIVSIQADEFGVPITAADQPDLADIPDFYQREGAFLVAVADDAIVGTIALRAIGGGQGALRKMFVASAFRGSAHGVGETLLRHLFARAAAAGIHDILLGTTEAFVAAHRFYEKHGFARIAVADLPPSFPRMPLDTRFYRRG